MLEKVNIKFLNILESMTFKKFSPQNSSIILNILSYRICVPIQFRNRNDFPKFVLKIDLNGIEVTDFQITISPLFSLQYKHS